MEASMIVWIKISDKMPTAHKPHLGLYRSIQGNLHPIIFCRRGKIKDSLFQGWSDLRMYNIEYWAKINIPDEHKEKN